jgi:ABC-type iron transport system FetAB permease component
MKRILDWILCAFISYAVFALVNYLTAHQNLSVSLFISVVLYFVVGYLLDNFYNRNNAFLVFLVVTAALILYPWIMGRTSELNLKHVLGGISFLFGYYFNRLSDVLKVICFVATVGIIIFFTYH